MDLPDDIALRLAVHEATAPLPLGVLSPGEQAQVETFGSEKRRREFALGRATARTVLAERLAVAALDVPLRVATDGAPVLDRGGLHVSIAHAATPQRTLAVAAVAERPVGVDLEVIRPRRPDLYRFVLHPDEYGLLETLPHDHNTAQVLVWTLKEATLKAMRTGFRTSPKKLQLIVDPAQQVASVRVDGAGTWTVHYDQHEGCFVAVAF